jgi:hypothetical protein
MESKAVLFLQKKNQKNFCFFAPEAAASPRHLSQMNQVFLLLFLQKKKSFLG